MVPRQWRSANSHHGSEQLRSPPAHPENNGDISALPKTIGAASSQNLPTSGLFYARDTCPPSSPQPCGMWGKGPSRMIQDLPKALFLLSPWPPPCASLERHLLPVSSWLAHFPWDTRMETSSQKSYSSPSSCGYLCASHEKCISSLPVCLNLDEIPADTRRRKVSPPGTADLCLLSKGIVWAGTMTETLPLPPGPGL